MVIPLGGEGFGNLPAAQEYLTRRNLSQEFLGAAVQRSIARGSRSPCNNVKWASFKSGCSTYHGFFPTAEILRLVSSPIHHPLFI